jgi:hypothetical protein
MFLYCGSRSGELPYPEANVGKELTETSSDLEKHLSPMEYYFARYLIQSPPHGLHLVSMP